MQEEQPLQVARCTKIIQDDKDSEKSKYVINVKQIAKFVVKLGERVSPTDIEEGMRVGWVSHMGQGFFQDWNLISGPVSTGINTKYYYRCRQKSTQALQ